MPSHSAMGIKNLSRFHFHFRVISTIDCSPTSFHVQSTDSTLCLKQHKWVRRKKPIRSSWKNKKIANFSPMIVPSRSPHITQQCPLLIFNIFFYIFMPIINFNDKSLIYSNFWRPKLTRTCTTKLIHCFNSVLLVLA